MEARAATGWGTSSASRLADDGALSVDLASEVPVALSYGGIAHAVMMATPLDLADFAVGFTITDGIAPTAACVRHVAVDAHADQVSIEITLEPATLQRFLGERRRRSLRGHASCGVCGVEALDDVPRVPRRLSAGVAVSADAIREAVGAVRDHQPLSRATRAAHGAFAVSARGEIGFGREDVGRHNALDKLVGAAARADHDWTGGFCLITSRCSFEMVQKAVAAGISTLVALSAPTALAVRLAREGGLGLVAFAGGGDPVRFSS